MEKKTKLPTAATTSILTIITIFFWIGFEVYRAFTTKPTPPVPTEILTAVDPTLDTVTLNKLQDRIHLEDGQISNTTATITTPVPQPSISPIVITPTPIATNSATVSATPKP